MTARSTADTAGTAQRQAAVVGTCARFTRVALSSDTTLDQGPADARRRAAQLYGATGLVGGLGGEGRDQTWPVLAQHHARVVVTTEPVHDDPPPAPQNQAGAAVSATRLAEGTDGWRMALPDVVAYCSLLRQDPGWRVEDITFSETTTRSVPR